MVVQLFGAFDSTFVMYQCTATEHPSTKPVQCTSCNGDQAAVPFFHPFLIFVNFLNFRWKRFRDNRSGFRWLTANWNGDSYSSSKHTGLGNTLDCCHLVKFLLCIFRILCFYYYFKMINFTCISCQPRVIYVTPLPVFPV